MNTGLVALFVGIIGCLVARPILALDTLTYSENVLHTFLGGTDGASPQTSLINLNGTLYGTTSAGGGTGCGGQGCGTVFSLDPNSGAETVLYSFCSQQNCADGAIPVTGLIAENGVFYGMTDVGGGGTHCSSTIGGCGTVFSFDPRTGIEKVLYSFCSQTSCTDGKVPSSLLDVKGTLYGTTAQGGSNCTSDGDGCGTVFSLDPGTGTETVVYSFCPDNNLCIDGLNPFGALINVRGTLYGTTYLGGNSSYCLGGCGSVFAFDPKTGVETVVHSFCYNQNSNCTDGTLPFAGPIDMKGTLYGTTYGGGVNSGCCGTVFSLKPGTGTEAVLYSFCSKRNCADGDDPEALTDVKGVLYGTASGGGKAGYGSAFSLDPNTGSETMLYSFCAKANCTDGAIPVAGLLAVNGNLYGTTASGGGTGCGGPGCGTVFVLKKKR